MIPPPDSPEGAMLRFIRKRAVASLISLVGLIVMIIAQLRRRRRLSKAAQPRA